MSKQTCSMCERLAEKTLKISNGWGKNTMYFCAPCFEAFEYGYQVSVDGDTYKVKKEKRGKNEPVTA